MISIDTNILFHAFNADSPNHDKAFQWITSLSDREDVVVSEFILAELYRLVRNPVVTGNRALSPQAAVELVESYRRHPLWLTVGFSYNSRDLHDRLWKQASQKNFAYRKLFDWRTALILIEHGVTEFATTNEKDFVGVGFGRVWNPIA